MTRATRRIGRIAFLALAAAVPVHAGHSCSESQRRTGEAGVDQDCGRRRKPLELVSEAQAVPVGELIVEQQHVGAVALDLAQRVGRPGRSRHGDDSRLRAQGGDQPVQDGGVVVDDERSDHDARKSCGPVREPP